MSVIRILADKYAQEDAGCSAEDCLITWGEYWRKEFNIPIFTFSINAADGWDYPMLPTEIASQIKALDHQAKVGDVLTWKSKRIVILEALQEDNTNKCGPYFLLTFAPAELIAIHK